MERKIGEELEKSNQSLTRLTNDIASIDFLKDKELENLPHKILFEQIHANLINWKRKVEDMLKSLNSELSVINKAIDEHRGSIVKGIEDEELKVESQFNSIPGVSGKTGKQIGVEYREILQKIERIKPLGDEVKNLSENENKYIQERRNLLGRLSDLRFNCRTLDLI
ncbi:hypothetical protein [Candidiatus Paracoxiella cheracis]|uniref:hypothetical protein n=1 Tax=Candidiatus Paracoxiella cheracis TaxID=3405120 RepID=UPI003BF51AB1